MMNGLNKSIKMDNNSLLDFHISNDHFHKAIKRLKFEKQDGVFNKLASEHFINATKLYYEHLHSLFVYCLKPGYMPNAMILCTLLPIPKDNNDLQNSPKYRGIALSVICIKVFEYIILELYGHLSASSELQFAYKSKASTTQCTWMAREVILYYNNNGSHVYACLLDCSKAFDHVRHDKLLQKLKEWNMFQIFSYHLISICF